MNDWYNDPPETEEPPSCPKCGADDTGVVELYSADGDSGLVFHCPVCRNRWPIPSDPEPGPEDYDEDALARFLDDPSGARTCPHGLDPAECDACFRQSDFAYDARRERS